jgi:putative membrane protein
MKFGNGSGIVRGLFPGGITTILGTLMILIMVALLVVILVFVLKMYKNMNNGRVLQKNIQNSFTPPVSPALQILDERFAKGEISEEEYINKKSQILR